MNNSRGSQWRKWDLHVHTPASFSWEGGKNLRKMSEKEKKAELEKFSETVNDSEVTVFALMDYWTFDWYLEIDNADIEKTIFPGMELRIESPTNYRLNIQVILSNELTEQQLEDFKSELKIRSIDRKLSNEALISFAKSLDKSKAEKFGYDNPEVLSEHELFQLGSKTAEITKNSLERALNSIPEGTGYIIMPYDTTDGLSELEWEEHPHDDNYFMQSAHIFETRSNESINLFSGRKTKENKDIFDNFFKTLGEKPKPCIAGSDAHKFGDYGNYHSNKITWVKANPTFEGLEQIIYEPEPGERVCITENPPPHDYSQIISLELKGNESYEDKKDKFPPITLDDKVWFSPNLTSIIGPRASGKSVLVELIGYVADEFKKENTLENTEEKPLLKYLRNNFPNLEVKVDYKIGQEKKEKTREVSDFPMIDYSIPLEVEYWWQGKIEEVAKNSGKISDYLKDQMEDPLLEEKVESIEEYQEKLEKIEDQYEEKLDLKKKISELESEEGSLSEYFEKGDNNEFNQLLDNIEEINQKQESIEILIDNIESQINALEDAKQKIGKEVSFSKKDAKKLFEKDSKVYNLIEKLYQDDFLQDRIEKMNDLSSAVKKSEKQKSLEEAQEELNKKFRNLCEKRGINVTKEEYKRKNKKLKRIRKRIKNLGTKLDNIKEESKKEHAKLSANLEETRKNWIEKNKKILKEFNEKFNSSEVVVEWQDPKESDEFLVNWVYERFEEVNDSLKYKLNEYFGVESPHREDYVKDLLEEVIDIAKSEEEEPIDYIKNLLKNSKAPDLDKNESKEKIIDWYFENENTKILREILVMKLDYVSQLGENKIKYKDKVLGEDSMSFGEKCGALVEAVFFSGNHPLIIDQPEDHLDSKLIASEIVELAKQQKKNRQIIICSHDSNLVVLGDSELVNTLTEKGDSISLDAGTLENKETIDQISKTLEGGGEAFEKRKQKYSSIENNSSSNN